MTGRPRDRKCCEWGESGGNQGREGCGVAKATLVLPFTHCQSLLSPLWFLEGLEHPQTRSSSPTPASPFCPPKWWGGTCFVQIPA